MSDNSVYRGNQKIKGSGVAVDWTPELIEEFIRCKDDPIYFAENYIKIVHVDHGLIPIELFDYQKELIMNIVNNNYSLAVCGRQLGKTVSYVCFCLWYMLFNEYKTIGLMANKGQTARSILSRIQLAYENLPKWLQHGVIEYNKGSFEIENGCKIIACSTSSSTARGESFSAVIIDEAAFVENWDEFFTSVYPTISSGKDTKIVLVSTPNSLNFFYKFYVDALNGKNDYVVTEAIWSDRPDRDHEWKEKTIRAMGGDREKFAQEHENQFLGSSGSLISGWKLKELVHADPIYTSDEFRQYEEAIRGHEYAIICDVARGKGLDYSAFQVIDVTEMPFRQVAVFQSNLILPPDYAGVIYRTALGYGGAQVLVEINDIGGEVTNILHNDYEYENILYTESAGRAGKRISNGFGGGQIDMGIRTTKTVKNTGCSMFKMLIEGNQLIVNDFETIREISSFAKKGASYEAEAGKHDDLVMCLVLFSWLSNQDYFKQMTNTNTMMAMRERNIGEDSNELPFFGIMDDGIDDDGMDAGNDTWADAISF